MITLFLIAVVLILGTALYVAAEFAILGARVSRVRQHAAQGSAVAAGLLPIVSNTPRLDTYIAVCQIGITVTGLALGTFSQATFGVALGDLLDERTALEPGTAQGAGSLIVLLVITSVTVLFGELLPKTVALQYPLRTAIATYHPMRWSHLAFAPLLGLLNGSGALVLRWLGIAGERGHRHIHSPDEIEMLVRESREGGHIEERQRQRLQRTLRLNRRSVRQIMVPRRRIAAVDLNQPPEAILAEIAASPFTRLVAHRGSLENIEGYVHTKDVATALARRRDLGDMKPLIRPLHALPSRLTVDEVLSQLRNRRARLALVADQMGEVEGLVSIEDVMRELVGGLSDEFKQDLGPLKPQPLGGGSWRMPGRLPLDELTEWAHDTGIEPIWRGAGAETLAGWLIERVGLLPRVAQRIAVGSLVFTVEHLDGVAIDSVLVEHYPADVGGEDG
jgi:putative hemolysin